MVATTLQVCPRAPSSWQLVHLCSGLGHRDATRKLTGRAIALFVSRAAAFAAFGLSTVHSDAECPDVPHWQLLHTRNLHPAAARSGARAFAGHGHGVVPLAGGVVRFRTTMSADHAERL